MIQLQNVTKFYQTRKGLRYVLKNVSLVIPDRANLAVLGPNGAGKSTFLRMIGGSEMPNSGKITSNVSISWPLGISSGFQGSLSGRSNVLFVCKINGLSVKWTRKVVEDVQTFAELGDYFDMPVSSYSSGMRARLSFGLSMAFSFDVYLIDELTSVGDANFRKKAVEAFEKLKDHASLVYVSHSLKSLRQTCDSALFLRDGNATFYPDIEEGVAAYMDYCEKQGKPSPAHKPLAKKAGRAKAPGKKVAKKAAKRAARKLAKKAATSALGKAEKDRSSQAVPHSARTPGKKNAVKSASGIAQKMASNAAPNSARKAARKAARSATRPVVVPALPASRPPRGRVAKKAAKNIT